MSNTTIQNIADLIVEEAKVINSHNNLISSIHQVQYLVGLEVTKREDEIRRAEVAWRLKKEIMGE